MVVKSARAAKEFLVSRIVDEARIEQVELSDLERKMLYFSEEYATLPNMIEVTEEFDAKYDREIYEKKIRKLSNQAFKRDRTESKEAAARWREAIEVLKQEDHYILVMLDVPRPATDVIKLFIAAIIVTALGIAAVASFQWLAQYSRYRIPDRFKLVAFICLFGFIAFISYSTRGGKLVDRFGDMFERVSKWF